MNVKTTDFKKKFVGWHTIIWIYPPPLINALLTPLAVNGKILSCSRYHIIANLNFCLMYYCKFKLLFHYCVWRQHIAMSRFNNKRGPKLSFRPTKKFQIHTLFSNEFKGPPIGKWTMPMQVHFLDMSRSQALHLHEYVSVLVYSKCFLVKISDKILLKIDIYSWIVLKELKRC